LTVSVSGEVGMWKYNELWATLYFWLKLVNR